MELFIIPKGGGKYAVTDAKDRTIYSVTKKRKLIGNPITTLHDASNYALYTMIRTESGKKPAFQIVFNDRVFLQAHCKSLFVDPRIEFEGEPGKYELRGKDTKQFDLKKDSDVIGGLSSETQANGDPKYKLTIEDKYYDDYFPLFAVIADKCFSGKNK